MKNSVQKIRKVCLNICKIKIHFKYFVILVAMYTSIKLKKLKDQQMIGRNVASVLINTHLIPRKYESMSKKVYKLTENRKKIQRNDAKIEKEISNSI